MQKTLPTIRSLMDEWRKSFREHGIETADLDSRMLLAQALKMSQAGLISRLDQTVSPDDTDAVSLAMKRRLNHEPVSRIIGSREFWGRAFEINSDTLDPRPDTESLIEAALRIIRDEFSEREELSVLDLGTGSGCILLTLLGECENASGVGIDINEGALKLARRNSDRLELSDRARFVCGDWMSSLHTQFDIVITNPPYIRSSDMAGLMPEVRDFDPVIALDGGVDGLNAYRRILSGINTILTSGWVILELGAGQLDDVLPMLERANLGVKKTDRLILSDLSGTIRTVAAKARLMNVTKKGLDISSPQANLNK